MMKSIYRTFLLHWANKRQYELSPCLFICHGSTNWSYHFYPSTSPCYLICVK